MNKLPEAGTKRPSTAVSAEASGFPTLFAKEVLRFWKVGTQTVAAPVLTALLYLLIFAQAMEGKVMVYEQISYSAFLVPGLVMMSVLQNAFANSASSLVQSKVTGNLVFMLLPPLSYWEFFGAYVLASVVRGVVVGVGVLLVAIAFVPLELAHPGWILVFALAGSALLGALGLIAGIIADKIDQMAAFQNFIIMPLTFLSGTFYLVERLPEPFRTFSHFNPFFYLIDGFRYGFLGSAEGSVLAGVVMTAGLVVALASACLWMFDTGYKIKS